MQKFIIITIVLIFIASSLAGCGDNTISTNNRQIYAASGHPEWWPIMYKKNDKITGVGADLTALIASDLGLSVDCKYAGTWDTVLEASRNGEIDLLVAAYKTDEREQYLNYSDAYITDPIAIYVKTGKSFSYEKWDDLIGKKGVTMTGDSYGEELDNYIADKLSVVQVATSAEAFGLLSNGQADYFLYSFYSGTKEISTSYPGQYESLPIYAAEENFYMAISKKSSLNSFMPQINAEIAKYKNNGTIDNIAQGYLSSIMAGK